MLYYQKTEEWKIAGLTVTAAVPENVGDVQSNGDIHWNDGGIYYKQQDPTPTPVAAAADASKQLAELSQEEVAHQGAKTAAVRPNAEQHDTNARTKLNSV